MFRFSILLPPPPPWSGLNERSCSGRKYHSSSRRRSHTTRPHPYDLLAFRKKIVNYTYSTGVEKANEIRTILVYVKSVDSTGRYGKNFAFKVSRTALTQSKRRYCETRAYFGGKLYGKPTSRRGSIKSRESNEHACLCVDGGTHACRGVVRSSLNLKISKFESKTTTQQ